MCGEVIMIEPMGAQTLVYFSYGGKTVTAIVDGERRVAVGENFRSGIGRCRVHVFEKQSGARIGE